MLPWSPSAWIKDFSRDKWDQTSKSMHATGIRISNKKIQATNIQVRTTEKFRQPTSRQPTKSQYQDTTLDGSAGAGTIYTVKIKPKLKLKLHVINPDELIAEPVTW